MTDILLFILNILLFILIVLMVLRLWQAQDHQRQMVRLINNFATMVGEFLEDKEDTF